jgi:hypothetical protein
MEKFNLSHHLISMRNCIGPPSGDVWAFSAAPASGWYDGDRIGDRRPVGIRCTNPD